MSKILYFEGAGMPETERSGDVGNCRIRTAFSLPDGKRVYLEVSAWQPSQLQADYYNERRGSGRMMKAGNLYADIESAFFIANDGIIDKDDHPHIKSVDLLFDWSLDGILKIVRSVGGDFDEVVCLPDLAGYSVHATTIQLFTEGRRYNYGDEFKYNPEQTARRIAKYRELYEEENRSGEKFPKLSSYEFPNFSFYVDPEDPDYCIKCINNGKFVNGERYIRYHIPA